MLVNETEYSINTFIGLFTKKFANYCSKAPVLLTFQTSIDGVVVKEQGSNKVLNYKFNHSISVKQNIKAIKDWLVENTYPEILQEKKVYLEYTPSEIDQLISDTGISIEQAVLMKKEIITPIKWKIMKVLVKKDELFLTNLSNNRQFRFRLKCPCTLFLRNLREKWDQKAGYNFFEKNSYMLNEIYPSEEEGND